MKPLYYLEFAKSVNDDNQPIPAKELKWFTPDSYKIAYTDPQFCEVNRLEIQPNLNNHIVRVAKAGLFKHISILLNEGAWLDSWAIIR